MLLWLESVSEVNLTTDESAADARRAIASYQVAAQKASQMLAESVIANDLTVEQIQALLFASRRPQVLTLLESIRDLVGEATPTATHESALHVAENVD